MTDPNRLNQPSRLAANMGQPIVSLKDVQKIYGKGETEVRALAGVSVDFAAGQFTSIMGPSGSGKSTMMHLLAGLDSLSAGSVTIEGVELNKLNDDQITKLRRERIGYVFQSFNLVPTLDAKANILLPGRLAGKKTDKQWFKQIVDALGLTNRLGHLPSQLSGGQQQRVAVARALVMRPAVIVADEPTGNLDSTSTDEVLGLLRQAVDQLGQTVIMVTHEPYCAAQTDRVLVVRDGRIVNDLWRPTLEQIAQVSR